MKLSILAAISALFGGAGSSLGKTKSSDPHGGQRTAAKSQRVMRIQRGMRPRHTVGARAIERRARHAIKGSVK